MKPTRIILKLDVDTRNVIYFLPDDPVKEGWIAFFSSTDGHGEADLRYFNECKPYRGTRDAAKAVMGYYENLHGHFAPAKRVYKI